MDLEGMSPLPSTRSQTVHSHKSDDNDVNMPSKKVNDMKSSQAQGLEPIPQPPKRFLIGNLHLIDPNFPIGSLGEIAQEYGPIVKMALGPKENTFVSSQELVNEICDEKRFRKSVGGPLQEIRAFAGDGLFTAQTFPPAQAEPNWAKAHRILMPAFGPQSIQSMLPNMLDIAEQLLLKWERLGPNESFDVVDSMTRLALDTISLCAFHYRFNNFYREDMHPFVDAMVDGLRQAGDRSRRFNVLKPLYYHENALFDKHVNYMFNVADTIIQDRKKAGPEGKKNDLLQRMLDGIDPISKERLSDENIRFQMITFLIAGHETTSGLLSFTFYYLLRNPDVLKKAQEEVDRVLGHRYPTIHDIPKLVYIDQILKESIRLQPTAPAFTVAPIQDTVVGGKYEFKEGDRLTILIPALHRDPKVWGPDPEVFRPERMAPELWAKLPPNAWKPFGNGSRACIGRPFAWQEATVVTAMILQRFTLSMEDPEYTLKIKQTLTIKPLNFAMRVKIRPDYEANRPTLSSAVSKDAVSSKSDIPPVVSQANRGRGVLILYGSNSGSCEGFAHNIGEDAGKMGFDPITVASLDDYVGRLPTKLTATIIVTCSYEGKPADNARDFVAWAEQLHEGKELEGVKYFVFGCGHKDWVDTYQRIPRLIDEKLALAGATRIFERGEANAAGDFVGDFDSWKERVWQKFGTPNQEKERQEASVFNVEVVAGKRQDILRLSDLQLAKVTKNQPLVDTDGDKYAMKRHIEIELPGGMTYLPGNYLQVLPTNGDEIVSRALTHFGLTKDDSIVIKKISGHVRAQFPTDAPVNAQQVLECYIELSAVASRNQIKTLLLHATNENEKGALEKLADGDFEDKIMKKRVSVLDLLATYPSIKLPLGTFLELSTPMRVRQYSISSSTNYLGEGKCSLTVGVLTAPAKSGLGIYKGVASNYLATLEPGAKVLASTRTSAFRMPEDPKIPIIMVGAGTGIAPFMGFTEERAALAKQGVELAPAYLFFGCRHPDHDFLYRKQLEEWDSQGLIALRPVFSRYQPTEIKYVQHKMWECRKEVFEQLKNNAKVYLCGEGGGMALEVKQTIGRIWKDGKGCGDEEMEKWMKEELSERFSVDVFI